MMAAVVHQILEFDDVEDNEVQKCISDTAMWENDGGVQDSSLPVFPIVMFVVASWVTAIRAKPRVPRLWWKAPCELTE